ncbi:hypothetical protein [Clostridium botulinum]|nr:hypothetical protein [Clostridium botulinum]MBY6918632.1 hypothetical protein [Clostridium botulinum]
MYVKIPNAIIKKKYIKHKSFVSYEGIQLPVNAHTTKPPNDAKNNK